MDQEICIMLQTDGPSREAGAAIKKAEEKLQPRIFQNRVFRV
jgi:hypothetical protein